MLRKRRTKTEIIRILEHYSLNWENKSKLITEILNSSTEAEEILFNLITDHKKDSVRKAAASILSYFESYSMAAELIPVIFSESDWGVRHSLARAINKHLKVNALSHIMDHYKTLTNDESIDSNLNYKKTLAEILGFIALDECIPILESLLSEIDSNKKKIDQELKQQILYAFGEIGNVSTVLLLLQYSAHNPYNTLEVRNSANHALDKIAKKAGFTTKQELLQDLNKM